MHETEDQRRTCGAARPFRVRALDGPDAGQQARLQGSMLVGTSELCTLRLTDPAVSRRHCTIEARGEWVQVKDEQSRNGTWLGAARIMVGELPADSEIRVGATSLRIEIDRFPHRAETGAELVGSFGRFIGRSSCLQSMYQLLERAAQTDTTVLLEGESGTGKELLAEALHDRSSRADQPFVVVDCGALPEALIESTLFGHERGAFTGADRARAGAFEQAAGGTVFLDEIGELPLALQTRLLGVLDRRQYRRVGGERMQDADARVVAATNKNLEREVEQGRFRLDLFHRLAVALVRIPPLRERADDIPLIAAQLAASFRVGAAGILHPELLARLGDQPWPGNVRELRNQIERLLLLGDAGYGSRPSSASDVITNRPISSEEGALRAIAAAASSGVPYRQARAAALEQFTELYVADMLRRHDANVSRAAHAAGVARRHFHRLKRG